MQAILLSNFIKGEVKNFRSNFNDSILEINSNLYNLVKWEVEKLTDELTHKIIDDDFDLSNGDIYDRKIATPINYSKNKIVALIIKYNGD